MSLWNTELNRSSIHLAVESSCGGTSLGIQLARQVIEGGGRVLWASPEIPNPTRFSQIFSGIDLTASSRFHATNLVGNVDKAFKSLSNSAKILPNVELVVIDDYAPKIGVIPKDIIVAVNDFVSQASWTTLLISKGGVSMSGEPLVARAANKIKTDQIWLLTRPDSDSKRKLFIGDEKVDLILKESGFHC
ncbi:MAG: hypothetical protein CMB16_05105 [Euryarchaeota archaeon]|nr:hypothetical protein [Euryarchaeota archaeon]